MGNNWIIAQLGHKAKGNRLRAAPRVPHRSPSTPESWGWHCGRTTANISPGEGHPQSWRGIMGDKGGKKDKAKSQKQKEQAKTKQEKQPKAKA